MTPSDPSPTDGEAGRRPDLVVRAVWLATVLFGTVAVAGVLSEAVLVRAIAAMTSLGLFAVGCIAYLAGYARHVQRSRTEEISMGAMVFLTGCAPEPIRRRLLGATAAQTVIGLGTAAMVPFTTLAFGILVPLLGIGCQTLWSSRYGTFAPRQSSKPAQGKPAQGKPVSRSSDGADADDGNG